VTDPVLIERAKAMIPDLQREVAARRADLQAATKRLAMAQNAARCPDASALAALVGEAAPAPAPAPSVSAAAKPAKARAKAKP
jgi:hypothetical protein